MIILNKRGVGGGIEVNHQSSDFPAMYIQMSLGHVRTHPNVKSDLSAVTLST